MRLDTHVEALLSDLNDIAAVGGDATSTASRRLIAALRSSASLRILGAISEAALEVSAQLPTGQIDVRLAGNDPTLVYTETSGSADAGPGDDGLTARISLRLPEGLKALIDEAATREGLSVNAWLVRTLNRAVTTPPTRRGPGQRLTGFASG